MGPQPPSGTVTFLFTDLEASTRLWEERPDEMRAALAEHDAVLKAAFERHGGYVFSIGGDGYGAAFGRAADAVAAAQEAQDAMAGLQHIAARMGINTGEVQERDGNYFGPPVNRGARLMAAGHGGQVLLAAITAELVPGLVLKNLGEHRLRDLGNPMLIWQLGTDDFPPLRTLDELPGNLPVQRTSFVGRAHEVKELAALVETERLVTLTGPGGVGKSRLALQVAAEVAPTFSDGVWFASLAALEEGTLAAATILEALGVPERRSEAALDTLCSWAQTREALVVIDNCEHLLAAVAAIVDRMLDGSTSISVLATTQALLGVRGEHAWTVAPLTGTDGVSLDSVELFVDRARMTRPDFDLTDENEAAVVEICGRLDHVPLAIELAAARVRGMAPADIARRLDQRLRLLTSSDRLAPGRHRTLDAAVRWSYELLDETERRVFDRLCGFAGGFTIEAAEAVVAGDGVDDWQVLDGILALVDKSLVVADERAGGTRYRLLETMRHFGHANTAEAGVFELYRDRHADYFADYVLSRLPQLQGAGDIAARPAVERELENIRVVCRLAADDHASSRFEALFIALHTVWMGRISEGASWAAELQRRPNLNPGARIVALGFAGNVMMNSDLAVAVTMAEAAVTLSDETRAAPALLAHSVLGMCAAMQGRTDTALACCDRLLPLAASEPDLFIRALALSTCYAVLGLCGAFDRLDELEREATAIADQLDNRFLDASIASSISGPLVHVTDPERARERLQRTYELNEQIGNQGANPSNLMFLAFHELRAGNDVDAAQWARRSLEVAIDHAPTYIAQAISPVVVIAKRRAPADAAVLLGALRALRVRRQVAGTPPEIEAEARYEASLRRRLGDQFDDLYAQGLALDEPDTIALAFSQLDAVEASSERCE